MSGLALRKYLTKSSQFLKFYKLIYYVDQDAFLDRCRFMLNGPVHYLEQIDSELQNYLCDFDLESYIVLVIPIIEEHYRHAIANTGIDLPELSNDFVEPLIVSDKVISYYERYFLYLWQVQGLSEAEIKKTCGNKFNKLIIQQVFAKLRKALDLRQKV